MTWEIVFIHFALSVILRYRTLVEVSLDMSGNAQRWHRIRAVPIRLQLDDLRPYKYIPSKVSPFDRTYGVIAGR